MKIKIFIHEGYTRLHLTSSNMAKYILEKLHYSGTGKILFLSNDIGPEYLRCLTLIGFKQLLGDRIVDVPKVPHIYTSYPKEAARRLYGKGFSYTRIIDDLEIDRDNIEARIRNKEFDLVIFGAMHRGLRYFDLVRSLYDPHQIAYVCGEDEDWHFLKANKSSNTCEYHHRLHNFFLREFGD